MSKKCLKCECELSDDSPNYCPDCIKELINESPKKEKRSTSAEDILTIIAYATLVIGVLGFYYFPKDNGNITIAFCILISSIITWAVLKVLSNISNNLHEINSKMKK